MPPKFTRAPRAAMGGAVGEVPETDKLFGLSGTLPRLIEADVARIAPNPHQPRTLFDGDELERLAQSIARHGMKQPILVQPAAVSGDYTLVAGERRWRAFQILGRRTIPAIITDGHADEIALIENVQRVDLDALDLARGIGRLMDAHGYTMAEAGCVLGCTEAEVSRRLSILRLPDDVLDSYRSQPERVSRSVLVELATLADDPDVVRRLWDEARGSLTVRTIRAAKKGQSTGSQDGDEAGAAATGLTRTIGRIEKSLAVFQTGTVVLDDGHRSRLRRLRDRIDALLQG